MSVEIIEFDDDIDPKKVDAIGDDHDEEEGV